VGGFSPERRVSEGDLILAKEADDLRALLKGDELAINKLDQVQGDRHIPDQLKHQFMQKVEARVRHWARQTSRPPLAGYEVMCNVVRRNRREWTLLGPQISADELSDAKGLIRLMNAERVYKTMLKARYRRLYPSVNAWVKAISADQSLLNEQISPAAKLSGKNQVAFWSERYQGMGIKIGRMKKYVELFQLNPADYPLGAVKFVLPPAHADVTKFHKPTAFDGMPHKGWIPPGPEAIWGVIRSTQAPEVKEAVSQPVDVALTTELEWIHAG
jgi:hypothetical protein